MANVDTIDITKLILVEQGSTPASPASGKDALFVRSSDHLLCTVNSSGVVTPWGGSLVNPMSAVGDIIQGTTAGAPARLAAPLAGKVLTGAGLTTPLVYSYPPGYELDRVTKTSSTNITATTSGTADTVLTSNSVTLDGGNYDVEFYAMGVTPASVVTADITILLRDDTASAIVAYMAYVTSQANNAAYHPVLARYRVAPAAGARVYSIRSLVSSGTGQVAAGAGGGAANAPAYIRIVKV